MRQIQIFIKIFASEIIIQYLILTHMINSDKSYSTKTMLY